MLKYWLKNRLLLDLIISVTLVVVVSFAFFVPIFENLGEARLMTSLYENKNLDFDIPSPSYDQIAQLESEESIESVFPYYYTKTNLLIGEKKRETNLFFSDAFDKLNQTMYCNERLIEETKLNYDNPVLVDYQFIKDTGAKLGTTISVTFGSNKIDFQISAIYETNTYYNGGAVIAKWKGQQKEAIMGISPKLVYSGAYVCATNHLQCKNYLEMQYKPLGRLKDRSEFLTQEAYDTHYNAFMSANYANEITDFSIKGQNAKTTAEAKVHSSTRFIIFSCVIMVMEVVVYNILMWLRKSEKGYFSKRKVSGGSNAIVYYLISTLVQSVVFIVGTMVALFVVSSNSVLYIPSSIVSKKMIMITIVTACISCVMVVENMVLAQKIKK